MDLVGSIINSKEYSIPIIKNEILSDDRKEQRDSILCNICGEIINRANMFLHKLTHVSKNDGEKALGNVPKNASNTGGKPSYACKICGKIYTERKKFVTHKNNHRRNKKLKEHGIHLFNKEACLNLKAMNNTAISESKPVNGNFKAKFELSVMTNPDVTMSINDSKGNSKFKPESSGKNMRNLDMTRNSTNGCSFKMKSEMPKKFTMSNNVDEKPMRVSDNNDGFKLKSELPGKLMINLDPTPSPFGVNSCNSKLKSDLPKKFAMYPDVTEKPACAFDNNGVFKSKSDLPGKLLINLDPTASPFGVNGCHSKLKSDMSKKLTMYSDVTEKPACASDNNGVFKLKSELPGKLLINLDPTANPFSVNDCSSKTKSETPMTFTVDSNANDKLIGVNYSMNDLTLKLKSIVDFDPTANPMSCAADWAPPKPVESHNDVPPRVPHIKLVSGDSSITKKSPAKKTLYRCYKCDKTYTIKKALVNHRVNHMQNDKKNKFLLYDRPNKKSKKSMRKIMGKAKKN